MTDTILFNGRIAELQLWFLSEQLVEFPLVRAGRRRSLHAYERPHSPKAI
jgi:hypothetical protein